MLSVFHEAHTRLRQLYNLVITDQKQIPQWLVSGITYLLPKSDEINNPKNYRSSTCLTTMYKILTSILTEYTYHLLLTVAYFQMNKKDANGCKGESLMNKMILENCHNRNTNLSIAWVDYKKVFDSVPHSWFEKCIETFKISPVLRTFLAHSMRTWKTTFLVLNTGKTH